MTAPNSYYTNYYSPKALGNIIPLCLTSLCGPYSSQLLGKVLKNANVKLLKNTNVKCNKPLLYGYVQSCDKSQALLCVYCADLHPKNWVCTASSPEAMYTDGFKLAGDFYPGGSEYCFQKRATLSDVIINANNVIGEVVEKIEERVLPKDGVCHIKKLAEKTNSAAFVDALYDVKSQVERAMGEVVSGIASVFGAIGALLFGGKQILDLFKAPLRVGGKEEMFVFAALVKAMCGDASDITCILQNPTLTRRKLLLALLF